MKEVPYLAAEGRVRKDIRSQNLTEEIIQDSAVCYPSTKGKICYSRKRDRQKKVAI